MSRHDAPSRLRDSARRSTGVAVPSSWARLIPAVAMVLLTTAARAQVLLERDQVPQLQNVGVIERLGNTLPPDLVLSDHRGRPLRLGDLFNRVTADGRPMPVILSLGYYRCPVVCPVVLDKLVRAINGVEGLVAGEDYLVLVVSFDPTESPDDAGRAQAEMVERYRPKGVSDSWSPSPAVSSGFVFAVSPERDSIDQAPRAEAPGDPVQQLADAVGWSYKLLASGEYSHPLGVMTLTPDGRVARYLHGLDYPSRDVKLSLLEATEGRLTRSLGDALAGFCWVYDPASGTYTLQAIRVMQVAGVATVVALVVFVGGLFAWERRARSRGAHGLAILGKGPGTRRRKTRGGTPSNRPDNNSSNKPSGLSVSLGVTHGN